VFSGHFTKGHQPFLVALAQDQDMTAAQVAASRRQLDQLGDPQSGGIQELKHSIVPQDERRFLRGLFQKPVDVHDTHGLGQTVTDFGWINIGHRVGDDQIFPGKKLEKRANGRQSSGIAARADFLLMAMAEKGTDLLGCD